MKALRVKINQYMRFRDFSLELTYPEGHERSGQPLDKICFIGQGGTGKTSLLRLFARLLESQEREEKAMAEFKFSAEFQAGRHKQWLFLEQDNEALYTPKSPNWNKREPEDVDYEAAHKPWLIHFPAESLEKGIGQLVPSTQPEEPFRVEAEVKAHKQAKSGGLKSKGVYDFSKDLPVDLWAGILTELKKFDEEDRLWQKRLTQSLLDGRSSKGHLDEYRNWVLTNPLIKLATALKPILDKFNLELKTEIESADDVNYLTLRAKDGSAVPLTGWSTGTKQLLVTAAPMCFLDTRQTVILVDEPERSLYPDVQRQVIPLYRNLAPAAQLIVATHSPVIASNFEPWEIFKLEFDASGHVVHRKNWDEQQGRTVCSYGHDPQYLRWDSIMRYFFDMDEEGSAHRMNLLTELAHLEAEMGQLKQQNKHSQLAAAWSTYKHKADLLDWKIPNAKN